MAYTLSEVRITTPSLQNWIDGVYGKGLSSTPNPPTDFPPDAMEVE